MKKLFMVVMLIGLLVLIVSPAAAATPTGSVGIYSVAACRDTTTVAVSGTSSYATNRIKVKVYVQNDKGQYDLRNNVTSDNFGSGAFMLPLTVDYSNKPVDEGRSLYIEVKLQGSSRGGFTDISVTSIYTTAADKYCQNKCSITITTSDRAPVNGTVTVRSHFGSWFRPEGWLHSAMPVNAGQALHYAVVGIPCNATVRAWYYPASGKDRTPKMLPAQYWPDSDFAATTADGAIPYAATFVKGLPATKPLESDDPYAPK